MLDHQDLEKGVRSMAQVQKGFQELAELDVEVWPQTVRRVINGKTWDCINLTFIVPMNEVD